MTRYRFAVTPRWILSHLFVLACIVAFVNLGFWQLRRLDGKRTDNALVTARSQADPVPIEQLMQPLGGTIEASGFEFRRVLVTGTYQGADEVIVRNRSNNGAPGYWAVTPLMTSDGAAVIVNRGWIPMTMGDSGDRSGYQPPEATATITGLVQLSQHPEGLEVADPPDGKLEKVSRIDVDRLQKQISYDLYPLYVDLISQQPSSSAAIPRPVPAPPLDEGSHLGYAGQWFIFATLTVIVYPLLLRRVAKQKASEVSSVARESYASPGDVESSNDEVDSDALTPTGGPP